MTIDEHRLQTLLESYGDDDAFESRVSCPICGGSSRFSGTVLNIHPALRVAFDLRRCASCRHVWVSPMPNQNFLSYLYSKGSNSVIGAGWEGIEHEGLSIPERKTDAAERNHAPGRYFEIGLGKGGLYESFRRRSWVCAGVEPGSWGRYLPGVVQSIDEVEVQPIYDVLVAIDVLEHVTDPVGMVRTLRELAAPRARLYAAFPNNQSFRFAVQREKWRMLRPLGHVHYYSRQSLVTLFEMAGFHVVTAAKNDMGGWNWRRPRSLVSASIQAARLGDQWFVTAVPDAGETSS